MILDNLNNYKRYIDGDENIKKALEFIASQKDLANLEDGKYEIVPDEVIVHVVSKDTHAREEAKMEIHKKFMDIHYMIKGSERCHVAPLAENDYDENTDNGFWDCEDSYSVVIGEGEFYAVWPMEPHCPLCNVGSDAQPVKKIICKVKTK